MNASARVATAITTMRHETIAAAPVVTPRWQRLAAPALRTAAAGWYCAAMTGQLLFAVYIVGFFWRAAAHGRPDAWNKVLSPGYVPGDTVGNLVLASHLLFAVAVTVGGLLQLIPQLRQRHPRFHRWNGRVFLFSAVVAAVGGLVMVWTRKTGGDLSQHLGISLMALLILGCAGMALRHALERRFDLHRRWALRLFLVASGGWFFRVGLMLWIVVNRGPAGFDPKTFTGPFLTFLSFADYLVPLAVLELYFHAQARCTPPGQWAMAAGLGSLTVAMAVGIVIATGLLWLPHL